MSLIPELPRLSAARVASPSNSHLIYQCAKLHVYVEMIGLLWYLDGDGLWTVALWKYPSCCLVLVLEVRCAWILLLLLQPAQFESKVRSPGSSFEMEVWHFQKYWEHKIHVIFCAFQNLYHWSRRYSGNLLVFYPHKKSYFLLFSFQSGAIKLFLFYHWWCVLSCNVVVQPHNN